MEGEKREGITLPPPVPGAIPYKSAQHIGGGWRGWGEGGREGLGLTHAAAARAAVSVRRVRRCGSKPSNSVENDRLASIYFALKLRHLLLNFERARGP